MHSSKALCVFVYSCFAFLVGGARCTKVVPDGLPSLTTCTRQETDSFCSCTMSDGSGRYDLSSLSGSSSSPFFGPFSGRNASEKFTFDPCVPFTILNAITGEETACMEVAACQMVTFGSERRTTYAKIAVHDTMEFIYISTSSKKEMLLRYTNGKDEIFNPVVLEVHLNCPTQSGSGGSPSVTTLELIRAAPHAVAFKLTSPGACLIPTPQSGLSTGSILCLLFSVAFIVYFIGGVLLSVFVQNKSWSDAIPPNKDFWLDLPGLIKDGATFAMSGFQTPPPTHQRLGRVDEDDHVFHDTANDDDEEIDELKVKQGGGPSEPSSDGFTAVAV